MRLSMLCNMGVLSHTSSVSTVPQLTWMKMHMQQRHTLCIYVTRVGKVVASWSVGLRQSADTIPVVVGQRLLAAWSATACYAVVY